MAAAGRARGASRGGTPVGSAAARSARRAFSSPARGDQDPRRVPGTSGVSAKVVASRARRSSRSLGSAQPINATRAGAWPGFSASAPLGEDVRARSMRRRSRPAGPRSPCARARARTRQLDTSLDLGTTPSETAWTPPRRVTHARAAFAAARRRRCDEALHLPRRTGPATGMRNSDARRASTALKANGMERDNNSARRAHNRQTAMFERRPRTRSVNAISSASERRRRRRRDRAVAVWVPVGMLKSGRVV